MFSSCNSRLFICSFTRTRAFLDLAQYCDVLWPILANTIKMHQNQTCFRKRLHRQLGRWMFGRSVSELFRIQVYRELTFPNSRNVKQCSGPFMQFLGWRAMVICVTEMKRCPQCGAQYIFTGILWSFVAGKLGAVCICFTVADVKSKHVAEM